MRGMYVSEIWSIVKTKHGNAVLLKPRHMNIAVPIFIGALETQSILIAKEGLRLSRPLTHDLFINMLSHVNLTIRKVEIIEIKDDTYHARLIITGGVYSNETPLILDSRPSDAFAIAIRKKCPIYLSASVIEQTGIHLDYFINELMHQEQSSSDENESNDRFKSLREQLEQAVAEEEYEQAAEIRDLIRKLDAND